LLVTGGAGFVGSNFVELAVARGARVIVLDALTYAGRRDNLREALAGGRAELVVGDICDGALVRELLAARRPDALVNFAAESHVDRSIAGPDAFVRTNVVGAATLLGAALEHWRGLDPAAAARFRHVQISTDEVFGALGPTGAFDEDSPVAPSSPYSASKASADHLTRAWHHTFGLPTIITHCSNNYGPRQYPEKLIPLMIARALAREPLPVYGDGGNVRDWIHVHDHAHGVWLALTRGRPGRSYCLGGRAERRNLDIVRTLCRHLDELRPRADGRTHADGITFVADRPGHDWRYAIDDTRARTELGFERAHEFDEGLRDTVRWYLDHPAWLRPAREEELR
jgi:dTDP-glucose 4,6-dehydratase